MSFSPQNAENWKKAFEELFGKDVSIRDVRSEDFDAVHQNQHVGLSVVSLPTATYKVLSRIGLPTYESRLQEITDVKHVPEKELTPAEREMMEALTAVDQFLPNNRSSDIRIYVEKQIGQKIALVFSDQRSIHLYRGVLSSFEGRLIYIHEKTHHNPGGAQDASATLRNYLTAALANLAVSQLKKERPDFGES